MYPFHYAGDNRHASMLQAESMGGSVKKWSLDVIGLFLVLGCPGPGCSSPYYRAVKG